MAEPFVILLSNDLFFGGRIIDEAAATGLKVELAPTADSVGDRLQQPECLGLILDLSHPANPAEVAAAGPTDAERRFVAYGPHVRDDLFAAARTAGFETISRGTLNKSMHTMLSSFSAGQGPG